VHSQADVARPATGAVGREGQAPFGVREPSGGFRQRLQVFIDDVNGSDEGNVGRMRAVVQRVSSAEVDVNGEQVASIGPGLLVLLGIRVGDDEGAADRLARKVLALRVFEDGDGRMNLSASDVGGEILCVSNFTLYGDTRKGNRPSFVEAAPPAEAEPLYERVRAALGAAGGVFGARMSVSLVNDGPVTLVVDV
jgi:D-aminoacyl-tRNA deacylase